MMHSNEKTISIGLEYPINEIIKRYAEEQEISFEAASEHAIEAKKYLILCALNPDCPYSMRGPIDEFWHTFVTFTRQYMDYSNKIAGRYLHHTPNIDPRVHVSYRLNLSEVPPDQPQGTMKKYYQQMLQDYETAFQQKPPAHLWPKPRAEDGDQPDSCSCACGVCGSECSCIA